VPNRAEAVIEGISKDAAAAFCQKYTDRSSVSISVASDGDKLAITAEGMAAHASLPERGINAQTALLEMLAAMPFAKSKGFEYIRTLNRLFPHGDYHGSSLGIDMSDEKSGRMTVNFGVLRFSELEFSGTFDSRTPICADEADLVQNVRAVFEREAIAMTFHELNQSHHTPEETVFVQNLLRIYEEYTGEPGECLSMGGLTYVHDIPGGVAFGCAMPDEDNKAHGANEYIGLEHFITSAKMFTQVIIDMCG
jgi:succinyl-diaminopimelate desuccinylase